MGKADRDAQTLPMCSAWTREQEVDPIGTAGVYEGYLLVEWPLPWPRDFAELAALQPILSLLDDTGIRLQGLVPTSPIDQRRVICFRKSAGARFVRFVRFEQRFNAGDLGNLAFAVETVIGAFTTADFVPGSSVDKELLICSHGKRDRCCGSLGTSLALEVGKHSWTPEDGLRIWRTSHTGGHRFAPTVIMLPEGTVWGHLDSDLLSRIVTRSGTVDALLPHYRGCVGLGSPRIQAVERSVLARIGWGLLDRPRQGFELDNGKVRLETEEPDRSLVTWEANVQVGRILPSWSCGTRPEQATKFDQEWVVSNLTRV